MDLETLFDYTADGYEAIDQAFIDAVSKMLQLMYDDELGAENDNSDTPVRLHFNIVGRTEFYPNVWMYDSSAPDNYYPCLASTFFLNEDMSDIRTALSEPHWNEEKTTAPRPQYYEALKQITLRMIPDFCELSNGTGYSTPLVLRPQNSTDKLTTTGLYYDDKIVNVTTNLRNLSHTNGTLNIYTANSGKLAHAGGQCSEIQNNNINIVLGSQAFAVVPSDSKLLSAARNIAGSTSFTAENGKTYQIAINDNLIILPFAGEDLTYQDFQNLVQTNLDIKFPSYDTNKYGDKSDYYITPIDSIDVPLAPSVEMHDYSLGDAPSLVGGSATAFLNLFDALGILAPVLAVVLIRFLILKVRGH